MSRTPRALPALAAAAALALPWTSPWAGATARAQAPNQGTGERAGEKIGETIDRAARSIRRGARETAESLRETFARTRDSVNAMGVQARVYSRLHWDKSLNTATIDVGVSREGVTTLRGSVPDATAKARAAELALRTVGVSRVVDELVVHPPSASPETPTNDAGTSTSTTTTTKTKTRTKTKSPRTPPP
jgi:osmotically-inducible protein OsmY